MAKSKELKSLLMKVKEENAKVGLKLYIDFFGRNDGKAETPVLWPPHGKS